MIKMICAAIWLLISATVSAAEMTDVEKQAWDTLETQIGLTVYGKYQEAEKHFHPDLTQWGPSSPVPLPNSEGANRMLELQRDNSSARTLGHTLTPITVKVAGNTAIINALLQLLVQPSEGAEPVSVQYILHNTWVREEDRWRLLATYNTQLGDQ